MTPLLLLLLLFPLHCRITDHGIECWLLRVVTMASVFWVLVCLRLWRTLHSGFDVAFCFGRETCLVIYVLALSISILCDSWFESCDFFSAGNLLCNAFAWAVILIPILSPTKAVAASCRSDTGFCLFWCLALGIVLVFLNLNLFWVVISAAIS